MTTGRRRGPRTLAEHYARLKAEGKWDEYVARKQAQRETQERNAEEFYRAEKPLIGELRKAGLNVSSVVDLVNDKSNSYAAALPILLIHLQRPYLDRVRTAIARAVAIPEARYAWHTLVDLYRREPDNMTKDALALAVANSVDESAIDELIGLLRDKTLGGSRMLLLQGITRRRDPKTRAMLMDAKARKILMELGADPDLHEQIAYILKDEQKKAKRRQQRRESKKK